MSPFNRKCFQPSGERQEILVSLSYLPSAERLTVVLLKARNLYSPPNKDTIGKTRKIKIWPHWPPCSLQIHTSKSTWSWMDGGWRRRRRRRGRTRRAQSGMKPFPSRFHLLHFKILPLRSGLSSFRTFCSVWIKKKFWINFLRFACQTNRMTWWGAVRRWVRVWLVRGRQGLSWVTGRTWVKTSGNPSLSGTSSPKEPKRNSTSRREFWMSRFYTEMKAEMSFVF